MTEAELRKIVRDEIEKASLEEGGLFDTTRSIAINAIIQMGLAPPKAGGKPN